MQNRRYLFDNLKDGDLIGFHFKSWKYIAGVFIGGVTGKTGNDLKIPGLGHIGDQKTRYFYTLLLIITQLLKIKMLSIYLTVTFKEKMLTFIIQRLKQSLIVKNWLL